MKKSLEPNLWLSGHGTRPGGDYCFWCKPERYPDMPEDRTLCARCGHLIEIHINDPANHSMFVCDECEQELMDE